MSDPVDQQPEAGPSRPRAPPPTIDALFPPVFFSDPSRPPHPFEARPSYVDATCFSWCSQATHRRAEGWEPVCRMVCWKVDKDEGERIGAGVTKPATRRKGNNAEGINGSSTDDQDQGIRAIRRSIRRWIDERELSFFKGSLEEMYYIQHEQREVERKAERWEMERHRESLQQQKRTQAEEETAANGETAKTQSVAAATAPWQHPPLPPDWAGRPISVDRDRASIERYRRRKRDNLDWAVDVRDIGDTGRLIDVPLSSLLIKPYFAFLHRLDIILSPSRTFFSSYIRSFGDGTQTKIAGMLWERASSGEVLDFAGKLGKKVVGAWMRPWPSRGSQGDDDDNDNDDGGRPPRRPASGGSSNDRSGGTGTG